MADNSTTDKPADTGAAAQQTELESKMSPADAKFLATMFRYLPGPPLDMNWEAFAAEMGLKNANVAKVCKPTLLLLLPTPITLLFVPMLISSRLDVARSGPSSASLALPMPMPLPMARAMETATTMVVPLPSSPRPPRPIRRRERSQRRPVRLPLRLRRLRRHPLPSPRRRLLVMMTRTEKGAGRWLKISSGFLSNHHT